MIPGDDSVALASLRELIRRDPQTDETQTRDDRGRDLRDAMARIPDPPSDVQEARRDRTRRFGRFVLVDQLGRGGMATVWRAWDVEVGRFVALKVLRNDRNTMSRMARLRREAWAAGQLSHPNLVTVFGVEANAGRFCIVMEAVDGAAFDPKASHEIVAAQLAKVAWAVHAAHQQGVVHRDLKPANVLIDQQGEPKVVDFGLAGLREIDPLTHTGQIVGTLAYMAPEQLAGRRELIGPHSDVYAIGAMIYEALTGLPPRAQSTFIEALFHASSPIKRPQGPRGLVDVCCRAMEPDPAKRYTSAAELAEALEGALQPHTSQPGRVAWPLATGALLVVAAASLLPWQEAPQVSAEAPRPAPVEQVLPAPPPVELDAEALVARARACGDRGKLGAAERDLRRAIELDPGNKEAWALLAVVHLDNMDFGSGVRAATRAIALDPDSARAFAVRGRIRFLQSESAGSKADLERALKLDPVDVLSLAFFSETLMSLGELEEAIYYARQATGLDSNSAAAQQTLALALAQHNDYEPALEALNRAIALHPHPLSYARRGEIHYNLSNYDQAFADTATGLALEPAGQLARQMSAQLKHYASKLSVTR